MVHHEDDDACEQVPVIVVANTESAYRRKTTKTYRIVDRPASKPLWREQRHDWQQQQQQQQPQTRRVDYGCATSAPQPRQQNDQFQPVLGQLLSQQSTTNNNTNNNNLQRLPQQQISQNGANNTSHTCACRDRESADWVALTHLKGKPIAPYTLWMRPLCTHGCDDSEILILDKMCFPQENREAIEYTCDRTLHGTSSCGVVIVTDTRRPSQKEMRPKPSLFRFLPSCLRSVEEDVPYPPRQNECQIVAYAAGKVRTAHHCRQWLAQSMCLNLRSHDDPCGDLQSVAVAPAFRARGLGALVVRQAVECIWHKAQQLVKERDEKLKNPLQRQKCDKQDAAANGNSVGEGEDQWSDFDLNFVEGVELGEIGEYQEIGGCDKKNANDCPADATIAGVPCSDYELPQKPRSIRETAAAAAESSSRQPQRSKTAVHVTLCVRRDNESAIRLYCGLGFTFEKPQFLQTYGDGCEMFRMGTWVDL